MSALSTAPEFKITLAWEILPAFDGSLHAVDPDPDVSFQDEHAVSLCGRAVYLREATVTSSGMCGVCKDVSLERQAEFDADQRDADGAL